MADESTQNFIDKYFANSDRLFPHVHVLGTPLIELLSLRINNKNGTSSEVYGTIELIDGEGGVFNIYNRRAEDAETVAMGGLLILTIPKGRAISASNEVKISVDLKDKNQKNVIAKDSCTWDYKSKTDYEVVQSEEFYGDCGFATLQYITYKHAVIATIEVILVKGRNDDSGIDYADVYGEIYARCGDKSSILFKKMPNQSVRVSNGTYIELSRKVVAVPAYSPLVIETKLYNGDIDKQIVDKEEQFNTTHCSYFQGSWSDVEGQNGHVQLVVYWSHPYMHPLPRRKLKQKMEKDSNEETMDGKIQKEKRTKLNSDQPPSSTLSPSMNFLPDLSKLSTKSVDLLYLEVFSVRITRDKDEGLDVWGLIQFETWSHEYLFFIRDPTCAETNPLLTIMAPKDTLSAVEFCVNVNLRDTDGQVISAGHLQWGERNIDTPIPWYDKQLCSVIPGDIGYTAIHYTVFSDAVQAKIRIYFSSSIGCLKVHGSIFAEYSNYRYGTSYEKEYYRPRLFQRLVGDDQVLSQDPTIPLLKSVVAVPRDSTLIIDLDLIVNASSDMPETFKGNLQFKTNVDHEMEQKILGSRKNNLIVHVEWSEVPRFPVNWERDDESSDMEVYFD